MQTIANHFGPPETHRRIQAIAQQWRAERQAATGKTGALKINDISLPFGGAFDLCGNLSECRSDTILFPLGHVSHEVGIDIDGKGQRPTDVNTFLRYSNPTQTSTTLAPGVKKFDLVVFYGPTIDPATFTAELNGVAITPKFTVSPGGFSVVRLDLADGRNTLVLSVEGIRSDGRKGRDTDRLTFIVPTP